jgi:site-specific recombinase XerD
LVPATTTSLGNSHSAQVVDLWLGTKTSLHTRRAYQFEVDRFLSVTRKPLEQITLADLQSWTRLSNDQGLKPASQNRAITAIKSLLSFAHGIGYLQFNPGAALRQRPNREGLAGRILTEDEVFRLINSAGSGRDRLILSLLYYSGVRVSELCSLTWRDLQPRNAAGQITVFGKGGKTRSILLDSATWTQLQELRPRFEPNDDVPVFRSRRGGGPLDPSQVRRIVYAATKAAGLPQKVSPHWMRHAHASHALDHNAPIHLVQATLGHASVATTGRYLHARPAESSSLYLPASVKQQN